MKKLRITKNTLRLILLCLNISILFLYAYIHIISVDEREHLYASYLVHSGYMPYRDFFEHHHPLLWYTFSPLLYFFDNTPYIWYVIRTFSLIILFGCIGLVYKLTHFITENKISAILASLFYTSFNIVQNAGTEFRPDNLMILLLLSGLYYYLKYDKQRKWYNLALSYALLFLSFMALQKNLFMLIALSIIIIYSAVKKEQLRRPILITLLIPLALISGYILYLYHNHALKDYFELNWLIYLYRSLDYKMFSSYSYILPTIGILCVFLPNKNKNFYLNIIKILYITECINLLFSASSAQYLLTLYPFLAIIFASLLSQHKEKYQLSILAILFFVNTYTFYNIYNYPFVQVKRFVYLSGITLGNTDKKDLIIPDMLWTGGLRKSALGYYWFGLEGIARIDYSVFHRHDFPNLKLIILNHRPKIITNTAIRNCLNEKNQITLDCTNDQTIPEEILDNYLKSELMFLRTD